MVGAGLLLALAAVLTWVSTYTFSYDRILRPVPSGVMLDNAQIYPRPILRVENASTEAELQEIVRKAAAEGLKVSIAGSQHSQGGHTYTEGGVVLNMRSFKKILDIDVDRRLLHAQSGATWAEVQDALQPKGLALKVMQSSNIFTIGGTLGANAHGRDIHVTDVIEVVQSFRLLLASGEIVDVARGDELFGLAIGGYGMYGVILDVTLKVAPDELYAQHSVVLDYAEFPQHFEEEIRDKPEIALLLGRPSIDPAPETFLRELVVVTWEHTDETGDFALTEEKNVLRDRTAFNLSKDFDWMKSIRWDFQKRIELGTTTTRIVSRNNAMRPPVAPLKLLDTYTANESLIIQEYFIPTQHFVGFMDDMRDALNKHDMNVMSSTVRFTKANDEAVLSYAPDRDAFAIIQVSSVKLDAKSQKRAETATRQMVDAAVERGGSYYLTYQLYPTKEQLYKAYPRAHEAFTLKRKYDPRGTFSSVFYEHYGR